MNSDINVDMMKPRSLHEHNSINKDKNTTPTTKIHKNTKIKLYDAFIVNEVKISKKIAKIPGYYNNYEIVNDYCAIEVGNQNECVLENLEIVLNNINNNKYMLITYNSDKNQLLVDFNTFLFHLKTPKLFVFHVLDTYSYLLDSLHTLSTINVCFFDLCPENIFLGENYKPILKNFQNSLLVINTINDNYISIILRKIKNYTYKPLEIHLLYYLIVNTEITMSYSLIDVICNNYMEGLTFLDLFNDNYRENRRKMCRDCLVQYINKPRSEIMNKIFTFYKTWDSYSISIIYIHIFSHMIRVFELKDTFINAIANSLLHNIHPEPTKRETLTTTRNMLEEMYVKHADWSFIDTISNEKLTELYIVL